MQFLDTECKNMMIQNPDREELVLKNNLSDLQSTQSRQIPGLEAMRIVADTPEFTQVQADQA